MLKDFLKLLSGGTPPDRLEPDDARIAMAALMVSVARSDDSYTGEERDRIDRILAESYALTPAEASALRKDGELAEEQSSDTVRFTRLIKGAVPYEERYHVVEALWQVAATDGIQAEEHSQLRLVANLVGVSDKDSGIARRAALNNPEDG